MGIQKDYKDFCENAPVMIFSVNIRTKAINYCNKATVKLLGYKSKKSIIEKPIFSLFHRDFQKEVKKHFNTLKKVGKVFGAILQMQKANGEKLDINLDISAVKNSKGKIIQLFFIATIITKEIELINQLTLSNTQYYELLNKITNCVAIYEPINNGRNFVFTEFNKAAEKADNVERKNVIGRKVTDVFPGVKKMGLLKIFKKVWKTAQPERLNESFYKDEIRQGWRENYVYKLPNGQIVAIYEDLTLNKAKQMQLDESEMRFQTLVETAPDAIFLLDKTGKFIHANKAACESVGYSYDEIIGKNASFIEKMQTPSKLKSIWKQAHNNKMHRIEGLQQRKDGSLFPVEINLSVIYWGGQDIILAIARDLTKRKELEVNLLKTTLVLKLINTVNHILVYSKTESELLNKITKTLVSFKNYDFTWVTYKNDNDNDNDNKLSMAAYSSKSRTYLQENKHNLNVKFFKDCIATTTSLSHGKTVVVQDKQLRGVKTFSPKVCNSTGDLCGFASCISIPFYINIDVEGNNDASLNIYSKKKNAFNKSEVKLLESMAADLGYGIRALRRQKELEYRVKFEQTTMDIARLFASSKPGEIDGSILKALSSLGLLIKADKVCLFMLTEDKKRLLIEHEYMKKGITSCTNLFSNKPISLLPKFTKEIFELEYIYFPDIDKMPEKYKVEQKFWKNINIKSLLSIPIVHQKVNLGFINFTFYKIKNQKYERFIPLLKTASEIIGEGLNRKRAYYRTKAILQDQEVALINTIQAIGIAIEKKDPHTAGHQRRVAQLCVAIAKELKLPEKEILGLQLGALVHDIGKIYVPAEILNRTGPITPEEMSIIRQHPNIGYDIIKDIVFPWPISEIVCKHHERLDGSGYPKGIKAKDIPLLCRIVSVADVIEAMVSHRPYRPACKLDDALEEINKNKGKLYDKKIVDICTDLFINKNFKFDAESK